MENSQFFVAVGRALEPDLAERTDEWHDSRTVENAAISASATTELQIRIMPDVSVDAVRESG